MAPWFSRTVEVINFGLYWLEQLSLLATKETNSIRAGNSRVACCRTLIRHVVIMMLHRFWVALVYGCILYLSDILPDSTTNPFQLQFNGFLAPVSSVIPIENTSAGASGNPNFQNSLLANLSIPAKIQPYLIVIYFDRPMMVVYLS